MADLWVQLCDAGFADQQGVFDDAVDEDLRRLVLIGVEFSDGAFVEGKAEQSAEIAGPEPRLVFEEESLGT